MKSKINTSNLVLISLFIAMNIIFSKFLAINMDFLRIGFGFVPTAFCSMLFGPLIGGIAAIISDIIGAFLFPTGAFFPGFSISSLLTGIVYGIFLYKKPKSVFRLTLTVFIICLIINLGLNTLWISMLYGKAFMVLLVPRILKEFIMIPIQVVVLKAIWQYLIEKNNVIYEKFNSRVK